MSVIFFPAPDAFFFIRLGAFLWCFLLSVACCVCCCSSSLQWRNTKPCNTIQQAIARPPHLINWTNTMAAFGSVGANAFLSSPFLGEETVMDLPGSKYVTTLSTVSETTSIVVWWWTEKNVGPNPQTTRGATTHVYAHPKEPRIIYPSGNFIVVKNVEVSVVCIVMCAAEF